MSKKRILFVLQNAYRSTRYNFRNDDEWQRDLDRSHTGRRLREMIPDDASYHVINSSQMIGSSSGSCYPPDLAYISRKIKEIKPDIVCGCGKVAADGLRKSGVEFIELPHPAWRQLSKDMTTKIRNMLGNL